MKPISVTSVINKSGVLTLYILTDDGTLLKKSEDESRWTEVDSFPGHRDQLPVEPDPPMRNKGTKKRRS
jgi:hypothetical protein